MKSANILLILSLVILFVLSFTSLTYAQNPQKSSEFSDGLIPEQNGDFADPDNPKLRVRVFVHNPKQKNQEVSLPICTDPDSSSVTGAAGWKLPNTTITYNLNFSSVPSSVGSTNLPTIAANGFGQWTSALSSSSAKPTLIRGTDTTQTRSSYDGQNIIAWGRISASALGITYVRYYTNSGLVVDVDTILNKRYPWSWSGNTSSCGDPFSYDAQDILTHEEGHWFGLNDEYSATYANHTMYGYGDKYEIKKDTITTGDAAGIKAIYP